jgi:hypothetical protein
MVVLIALLATVTTAMAALQCPNAPPVTECHRYAGTAVTFESAALTCTPASGSLFQVGATPVQCTDGATSTASCDMLVAVADTKAPITFCPNLGGCKTLLAQLLPSGQCVAYVPDLRSTVFAGDECSRFADLTFDQSPSPHSWIHVSPTSPLVRVSTAVRDVSSNHKTCHLPSCVDFSACGITNSLETLATAAADAKRYLDWAAGLDQSVRFLFCGKKVTPFPLCR